MVVMWPKGARYKFKLIDIRNVDITKNGVKIRYGDILKMTRPGFQQKEINIKAYAPDRRLCVSM